MNEAAAPSDYEIRPFETIEEFRDCVELQEETWGAGFSERVPAAILKVSQILGGVSAGAYDASGGLVGFVFGMTGLRHGELVHWSDMLAVHDDVRDTGLGTRLKLYQRDQVVPLGVERMHWTFDPLQSRNAYLNFAKLGIVVREYRQDMYGDTDSPLHRGVGTDRFVALWLMKGERATRRASGADPAPTAIDFADAKRVLGAHDEGGVLHPGEPDLSGGNAELLVAIPSDIVHIMVRSIDVAVQWREATRATLTHYLDDGYEVRELLRAGPSSDYLLVREDLK